MRQVNTLEVSPYIDQYGKFDLRSFLRAEMRRREAEEARARAVAERRRSLRPAFEQLGSWGWACPSWGSEDLFENGGNWKTQADADEYFIREYRKNRGRRLNKLFKDMEECPILAPRAELLDQVRYNMRKKNFLVCLLALFSVLEGVLLECAGLLATPTVRVIGVASSIAEKAEPSHDYEILHWLDWLGIRAVIRTLFEKRSFDEPPPNRANRHWILHGRHLPVTGEVECLQLLQVIQSIAMDHYYGLISAE